MFYENPDSSETPLCKMSELLHFIPQSTFYPGSHPFSVVLLCCSIWFAWHFLTFALSLQKHLVNIPSIYFGTHISLQAAIEGCASLMPPDCNSCMLILIISLVLFHQNHYLLILIPAAHKVALCSP